MTVSWEILTTKASLDGATLIVYAEFTEDAYISQDVFLIGIPEASEPTRWEQQAGDWHKVGTGTRAEVPDIRPSIVDTLNAHADRLEGTLAKARRRNQSPVRTQPESDYTDLVGRVRS